MSVSESHSSAVIETVVSSLTPAFSTTALLTGFGKLLKSLVLPRLKVFAKGPSCNFRGTSLSLSIACLNANICRRFGGRYCLARCIVAFFLSSTTFRFLPAPAVLRNICGRQISTGIRRWNGIHGSMLPLITVHETTRNSELTRFSVKRFMCAININDRRFVG